MHPPISTRVGQVVVAAMLLLVPSKCAVAQLFDMDAMRDASTLELEVLQDWHRVDGPVATRQKLVTINVGEIWPGQKYRMPVRMVVPAERKAKGFHLTGGHFPEQLKRDARLSPLNQELIKGGVGPSDEILWP